MVDKRQVKLSEKGRSFLIDGCANHRIAHRDREQPFPWEFLELIANYFKKNNDRYLELIKMGVEKK